MHNLYHQSESYHWMAIRKRLENIDSLSKEFLDQLEATFLDVDQFDARQFDAFPLAEIFSYLKTSHVYYLEIWLPKIENTLQELTVKFGNKYLSVQVLRMFLRKYKTELINHIEHEEQVLFAFVEGMLQGTYSTEKKNFVISHFLHTHNDNVVLHLDELKKDLCTFDAELKNNMVFQVLFNQLSIFQSDLLVHGLIEDSVFMKKVLNYIGTNFENTVDMTNE